MASKGRLKIQCFNGDDYIPVDKCRVIVRKSVDSPDNTNETTKNATPIINELASAK